VRLSPSLNGIDTSLRNLMGAIAWNDIKIQPGSTADFPDEKQPSRYYAARATDAAPITAGGQHEKFLFYRGVGRMPVPLSARVSGRRQKWWSKTAGPTPFPPLSCSRIAAGAWAIATQARYRTGAIQSVVALDRPSLDGSFSQLRHDLETRWCARSVSQGGSSDGGDVAGFLV
jgi:hypothetical protein